MSALFHKLSIRMTIGLFLLFFTLIPSLLVCFFISSTTNITMKTRYAEDFVSLIVDSIKRNTTTVITQMNLSALTTTQNQGLYNAFFTEQSAAQRDEIIHTYLKSFVDESKYISGAELYAPSGIVYRYPFGDDFPSVQPAFVDGIDKKSIRVHESYVPYQGRNYLPVGKALYHFEKSFVMGKMVMYADSSMFREVFSDLPLNKSTIFITVNDIIISHSADTQIGKTLYIPGYMDSNIDKDRLRHVLSYAHLNLENLSDDIQITAMISYEDIYAAMGSINRRMIHIMLITSLFVIFIAFLIPGRVVADLKILTNNVLAVKKQKKLLRVKRTNNEIYVLQEKFNDMIDEIHSLMELNAQTQKKQREAELQALQAQIKPHFLYNTLDSITCMAKLNHQPDIETLAYSIAEYYRLTLCNGETIISMREEVEHARSYLVIKQTQYPEMFDFEIDIPEDIMQKKVIKLILQPIVENSIKHGFDGLPYKGLISITADTDRNGDIILTVLDNGRGMDFDPLLPGSNSGYGLKNINERLRLLASEDYGLLFQSKPGMGTRVVIKLPGAYDETNGSTLDLSPSG